MNALHASLVLGWIGCLPFLWHGQTAPPKPAHPTPAGTGPGSSGGGPSTPSPGGPSTAPPRGPAGPSGSPNTPTTPATGAPARSGNPGAGPQTGGGAADRYQDPTWDLWWHFHREEFLDLKRRVHAGLHSPEGFSRDADLAAQLAGSFRPSPKQVREEVVPLLREVLTSEHNHELVTSTLLAAGRLGEFPNTPAEERLGRLLEVRLRDANQEICEVAALSLGILGGDDGLELLAALLSDGERGRALAGAREVPMRTRSFAAFGLGVLAAHTRSQRSLQQIARVLTEQLARTHGVATDTQVACVIALGLVPLEVEREESASAPWISRQTELRFLIQLFEDPQTRPAVRAHAATSLAGLAADSTPEARMAVVDLLASTLRRDQADVCVRESCAMGLGRLVDDDQDLLDKRVRTELRRAVQSGTAGERAFALMSLSEAGSRRGTGVEPGAAAAECRGVLLEELARGRSQVRCWAALGLGVQEHRLRRAQATPSSEVQEALRRAFLDAAGPDEQCATGMALGLAADAAGMKLLVERLAKGGDDVLRGYFALAIGLAGQNEHAEALRTVAAGAKYRPFLLQQCAIALALLGDKSLAPRLASELRAADGQASQSWLAQALGAVGDTRTVTALIPMVRDKGLTDSARGYISGALGIICDKDELPWYHTLSSRVNWRAPSSTLLSGDGLGVLEIL